MRFQDILWGIFIAALLGLVLFFVGGVLLAVLVFLPLAVILAALLGKLKIEVRRF